MRALARPFLDQASRPNRVEEFSVAGCSLLTDAVRWVPSLASSPVLLPRDAT